MTIEKVISGFEAGGQAKTMDVGFDKFLAILSGTSVFHAKMAASGVAAPMGMTARMA
jgi:hypothetical protein